MKNSRPLMFAASSVWVALILVVFVFRGGGTTPVHERRPAPSGPGLVQQADELAALGEYAPAVEKYWAALDRDPDNISLRFALGSALSHADRQEETVEQFRWVVTRGNAESLEVQVARRWLVSAGVMAERAPFAAEAPGFGTAGKVTGKTAWKGAEGSPRQVRVVLRGAHESNQEAAFDTSVTLGEPYEFPEVPPGNYLLTARVSGTTLWEEPVVVEPGQTTMLDLTDDNAAVRAAQRSGPASEAR